MLELQDWRDFSISSWYPLFSEETIKSIIIEPDKDFLQMILNSNNGNDSEEIEYNDEYLVPIKNALNSLNRDVFLRNNWRAPLDAKAFSFGNSLKVTNIDDLILFLSVSDMIARDFENNKGIPFCLVLRPWLNVHPASEFRCIVINNILRGISPRDWPTYYEYYIEDGPQIVNKIHNFFKSKISHKFPRSNYIFDIILVLPNEPTIVDFSPLNQKTNLLAFSWKEIHSIIKKNSLEEVSPVFRYLEKDIGIMEKGKARQIFKQFE